MVIGAARCVRASTCTPLRAKERASTAKSARLPSGEKQLKKKIGEAEARTRRTRGKGRQLSGSSAVPEAEKEKGLEGELKRVQNELSAILEPQVSARQREHQAPR